MTGRIRQRASFGRFRTEGQRFRHGVVWCSWVDDRAASPPLVAYAIGRATGGAVVRNRVRRRLRALIAEEARSAGLPAGLLLVGVQPGAATASFATLRDGVAGVARQVRVVAGHG